MVNRASGERVSEQNSTRVDAAWIIPFFAIVTSAVVFFFSQMAQYNLLPH